MGRTALKAEVRSAPGFRALAELREIEDTGLVNAYLDGETRSFDVLVERYQTRLLNFVYRIVGDRERGEDLVQEVFISVYRHLGRFDRSKKFSTWIYTIASNLAKNELRNRSRNPLVLFKSMTKGWDDEERPLEFEDHRRARMTFSASDMCANSWRRRSHSCRAPSAGVRPARDRRALVRGDRGDHALQPRNGEVAAEPGTELVRRNHRTLATLAGQEFPPWGWGYIGCGVGVIVQSEPGQGWRVP